MNRTAETVKLRRGNERYYVEANGKSLGWVVKRDGYWFAYRRDESGLTGSPINQGESLRRDAVLSLLIKSHVDFNVVSSWYDRQLDRSLGL